MTYAESWWRAFRRAFVAQLVSLGVVPVCGATMPGGPTADISQCKRDGVPTGSSSEGDLHLHHEPALSEAEASDRAIVCDPLRIVLLCDRCHNAETARWHAA